MLRYVYIEFFNTHCYTSFVPLPSSALSCSSSFLQYFFIPFAFFLPPSSLVPSSLNLFTHPNLLSFFVQVGKTTLMVKYVENKFDEDYIQTLGVNFMEKTIQLRNTEITFSIWDLGGQREFLSLLPLVCNDSVAIFFMFDLSRKSTLLNIKEWYRQARGLNRVCFLFPLNSKNFLSLFFSLFFFLFFSISFFMSFCCIIPRSVILSLFSMFSRSRLIRPPPPYFLPSLPSHFSCPSLSVPL